MKKIIKVIMLFSCCLFIVACSDETSSSADTKNDHVWKEQTDTINKAKEVEGMLMNSAENTRNAIEQQQ